MKNNINPETQKKEKTNINNKTTQNNKSKVNAHLNKKVVNKNTKPKINDKYGFDIYDKKNAQEFNRQFLGLNNNNSNGIFVGEGIFNMDLPMHKPGEVPDFSNPYGNNFFTSKEKGIKLNPRTQPLEYLQNFFGGFGIEFPVKDIINSPNVNSNNKLNKKNIRPNNKNVSAPKVLKKQNLNNINKVNNKEDKNIKVNRHEFDRSIFNTNYITNNSDLFNENYCSNFKSNLEKEVFDYLMSLIKGNRVLASQQKQAPIKNDIFDKLNKFEMSEKYMKKNGDSFESPFCCICLLNINCKQKCLLLPCGHLFHFQCAKLWLNKNSICPMCRLDLNDYFMNKNNEHLTKKFK